ncbi:hypothetical protein [Micromonospora haikouensis]|uniref:hypothetical protein n=1 Tax=Micromonospora haikouensis TaxID=686309 RepID=UPI003D7241B1
MSKREDERARRRRVFWSEKRAKARGDLTATVNLRFDELRAELRELPKGTQAAWLRTADATLQDLVRQVRNSHSTTRPPATAGGPRQP